MNHQEWLDARRRGVTATDISALMGVNPYKKEADVLMDKLNMCPKFSGSAATKAGVALEPHVGSLYSKRNQIIITNGEFTKCQSNERYIGTPDYLTTIGGLEVKTGQEKTWIKGCPKHYEAQCRWYMLITDRDLWDLYGLVVPKDRSQIPEFTYEWAEFQPVREFRFTRDRAIEQEMKDVADRFLEKVDKIMWGEIQSILEDQLPWRAKVNQLLSEK